jgi:surface antigen
MIFIQRNVQPLKDNKYYGRPDPFISSGYGMFQNNGNCVDYAYCRYREEQQDMNASNNLPTSNAYNWYAEAKKRGFKVGTTPKLGAIGVFGIPAKKIGHVAVVEEIIGNKVKYSSSAWKKYIFKTKTLNIGAKWGINYPLIGYIYPNVEFEDDLPIKGDYKVISPRYVRTGAGTEYPIKKVKDLTKDGQKNCTSTNKNAKAQYKSGTIFTNQKSVKASNGSIWAKTPSGYVCLSSHTGTMYCSKI